MRPVLDYSRWPEPRHAWASIDAFLAAAPVDGVHTLGGEGDLPIDLLLLNAARLGAPRRRILPVFLSGAVTARGNAAGPFFSGRGMARAAGMPALCIADPTLAVDSTLTLAWYAGSQWQRTQPVLSRLLAAVAQAWQVEPLLIGGSGAGFAALQLGAVLGSRASVLVWNPQTNLLGYYRPAVLEYLRTAFPQEAWQEETALARAPDFLAQHGIVSALPAEYAAGRRPRRLLYLQNASDEFHVLHHAGPLLGGMDLLARGNRYESDNGDALFWFGAWGQGHEPIPKPVLAALIDRLADPALEPSSLASDLASSMPAATRGLPLSFAHAAQGATLRLQATTHAGRLEAMATIDGLPEDAAPPAFAFYVFSGTDRIQQRWYRPDASATFPLLAGRPPDRVVVFARDSFGNKLKAAAPARNRGPAAGGD